MERWTRLIIRYRWPVLAVWLVVLLGGGYASGKLSALLSNTFTMPGTDSERPRAPARTWQRPHPLRRHRLDAQPRRREGLHRRHPPGAAARERRPVVRHRPGGDPARPRSDLQRGPEERRAAHRAPRGDRDP